MKHLTIALVILVELAAVAAVIYVRAGQLQNPQHVAALCQR